MKILLIENNAKDFYLSRLSFAIYLQQSGFEVTALLPWDKNYINIIRANNIETITYNFNRLNKGIIQLLKLIFYFRNIFSIRKFDYVHSFRFQPNLVNVISSLGFRHKIIIHITGLGIVFSKTTPLFFILRFFSHVIYFFKSVLADTIIVQNPDDVTDIFSLRIFKKKVFVIEGSGVDCTKFDSRMFNKPALRNEYNIDLNAVMFICVTRLIWEKGIRELVEAFEQLKSDFPNIILFIIGSPDLDNPNHVSVDYIEQVNKKGTIRFFGNSDQINALLAASDYFVYPSYYREGVPRSLLEALSAGLPILASDTPGCRLTVISGVNGLLIEPKSVQSIVEGVKDITKMNSELMGIASRDIALNKFNSDLIYLQIKQLYK